jgi:hypothetical protein
MVLHWGNDGKVAVQSAAPQMMELAPFGMPMRLVV